MRTLLIIEPHFTGHRAGYVAWIAEAAAERGSSVKIATLSTNLSHPLLGPLQESLGSNLELIVLDKKDNARRSRGVLGLITKELRYWRLLKSLYSVSSSGSSSDTVLVPYLDYCANAIGLLGSPFGAAAWAGIVMRQAFHFRVPSVKGRETNLRWAKHKLFDRLLVSQTLKSLFTIDESLIEFVRGRQKESTEKLVYIPDPASHEKRLDIEAARTSLGIRPEAVVILVYGGISERKGVRELLTALGALCADLKLDVIIAGRQSDNVREIINCPEFASLVGSGQLHQIDRFLDAEDELRVFSAADIVWLGYKEFYTMSGVLVQAGQMSLPVIATSDGLIGHLTSTHGLGLVVEIRDTVDVQKAIKTLAMSSSLRTELGRNGKRKFSTHTVRNFVDTILNSL